MDRKIPQPMLSVHIKLSDKGWILEQCAQELAARLEYVTYDLKPDPSATIQYYMTYGSRENRVSKLEASFVTHLEEQADARELFYRIARSVDLNICMSERYRSLLTTSGITNSTVIKPGVDLAEFAPNIRIGVVGRTYHTGRKGEHVVADVLDVPGIEWFFTGSGWPLPALDLAPGEMPEFYRSMDYVLIPSLYEGGPMSAIEALACGTPIIAPDVGWIPDYPHIPFSVGDSGDLRRVLSQLIAEKAMLRKHVVGQTWDRFAEQHDVSFRKLISDKFPGERIVPAKPMRPANINQKQRKIGKVSLILHGVESQLVGGPSIRVPELAQALRSQGFDVQQATPNDVQKSELAHVFNVWQPTDATAALKALRTRGARILFSPIFIDLSARHLWDRELVALFENALDADLPAALQSFRDTYEDFSLVPFSERQEPFPNYYDQLRVMISLADHIAFLSDDEREKLSTVAGKPVSGSLVRNAAAPMTTQKADPALFQTTFPFVPKQFVLCVGRIETRKNQLMLAVAARKQGLPLVLAGDISDEDYADLIRRFGGANVYLLGRLEIASGLLQSAIAAASAVALPSWAEGIPLSGLEAVAAGKNVVLSDQPHLKEYFGETVDYCKPHDVDDIGQRIYSAVRKSAENENRKRVQDVSKIPTWADHVDDTLQAYAKCIDKPRNMVGRFPIDAAVADSQLLKERLKREEADFQAWHIDQHAGALATRVEEQTAVIARLEHQLAAAREANETGNAKHEHDRSAWRVERDDIAARNNALVRQNQDILASYSWRITAPFRKFTAIYLYCRRLLRL